MSTDGGQTFTHLATLGRDADQPTVTAAAGSVWITFSDGNKTVATGAPVTGLGAVGEFGELANITGGKGATFGDIAISADGQVAVTYQLRVGRRSILGVNIDPDGLGSEPFGPRVVATNTNVKLFDIVPAQHKRAIDAEVALAYDRSGGPYNGRLYILYTDVAKGVARDRNNTDIFLRYSTDGGLHFGNALRVNDDEATATQLLPRLAIDQTSGQVAVTWLDTRDDQLASSPDDTDDKVGTDVVLYGAVATPTPEGLSITANARIAAASTNAAASDNEVELGDYLGLDFREGLLHPVWSDNSNSTADNPDGAGADLDLFTANVSASGFAFSGRELHAGLLVGEGPGALLIASDYPVTRKASPLKLTILFADGDGLDRASLDGNELRVTGRNGFDAAATLRNVKLARDGTSALATYLIAGPEGRWSASSNGVYTIHLSGSLSDRLGNAVTGGEIGNVVVSLP